MRVIGVRRAALLASCADEKIAHRCDLDPFTIVLTDDNFSTPFGGEAGERITWVDGHWALLEPLPPGEYTLEFGGSLCDENDEIYFDTLATYTLHVED